MSLRVLVVDDSAFYRHRIVDILETAPGITVAGTAANGREALMQLMRVQPDVVTMDIEMPVMDGITAVRRIMNMRPTPVLMFSSLTQEGARATLDALDAGAMDFMPKRLEDVARGRKAGARLLCDKIRALARRGAVRRAAVRPVPAVPRPVRRHGPGRCRAVAIGCSTGGPVALTQVLSALPGHFAFPLLLVQHMPASFTPAFAGRMNQRCAIEVREAAHGDVLTPGVALLAPGGRQMVVESTRGRQRVAIVESEPEQHYRPSVDVTFSSLAAALPGAALAIVLTGMGADGREGARLLHEGGSEIWAQDEASSVVYGMPAAIAQAGLANRIMPLEQFGAELARHR